MRMWFIGVLMILVGASVGRAAPPCDRPGEASTAPIRAGVLAPALRATLRAAGTFPRCGLPAPKAEALPELTHFPCLISNRFGAPPQLTLIGEAHESNSSKIMFDYLSQHVAPGDPESTWLAMEGSFDGVTDFDRERSRQFLAGNFRDIGLRNFRPEKFQVAGMDEPRILPLSMLVISAGMAAGENSLEHISPDIGKASENLHRGIFGQILTNPYLQEGWRQFRLAVAIEDPVEKKIATWIDQAVCMSIRPDEAHSAALAISSMPEFQDHAAVGRLFHKLGHTYVSYLSRVDPGFSAERVQLSRHVLDHPKDQNAGNQFYDDINIERRNLGIVSNLARLYCEAYRDRKPLVAVMGLDHISGVVKALKRVAQGQVPIRRLTVNDFLAQQFDQGFKTQLIVPLDPERAVITDDDQVLHIVQAPPGK